MPRTPDWFDSDREVLTNFAESLGIQISMFDEDDSITELVDGQYDKDNRLILIDPALEKTPSVYISTLLHEIGHFFEMALRMVSSSEYAKPKQTLISEYMAGVFGCALHQKLGIEMPMVYYLKNNRDNIGQYLDDIKEEVNNKRKFNLIMKEVSRCVELSMYIVQENIFPGVFLSRSLKWKLPNNK